MGLNQIKIYALMSIGIILSCSSTFKMIDTKLIQGKWLGRYDNIDIVLTFKKDSGSVVYFPQNKVFHFGYRFKSDSVLTISNGDKESNHQIKYLTDTTLRMSPYAVLSDSESIDLIDMVQFKR